MAVTLKCKNTGKKKSRPSEKRGESSSNSKNKLLSFHIIKTQCWKTKTAFLNNTTQLTKKSNRHKKLRTRQLEGLFILLRFSFVSPTILFGLFCPPGSGSSRVQSDRQTLMTSPRRKYKPKWRKKATSMLFTHKLPVVAPQ